MSNIFCLGDRSKIILRVYRLGTYRENLLIIAAKNPRPVDRDLLFRKAAAFQEQFGVTRQRLGDLLRPK